MDGREPDRMPSLAFRMMRMAMAIQDRLFPHVDERIEGFGIEAGMVLVDYGCGPGRYAIPLAKRVGYRGKVYAVDVQELALATVRRKAQAAGLTNIVPILAFGYHANIPPHVAEMVFAIDMIHNTHEPVALLKELHRLCRRDGVLVIDDNHRPRTLTLQVLAASGRWTVVSESADHVRCTPVPGGNGAGKRDAARLARQEIA